MTWNATSGFWELVADTSACGAITADTGVTIDVTAVDPDCGTTINAPQVTNVTIDNTLITPDWGACTITSGRQAFPDTQSTMTAAVTITDPTQAFLLVDIAGGAVETNTADHMSTGYILDANTLQFDRAGTTGPNAWVSYQLVECFNNELYVQRGPLALAAGTASNTATLTQTVDPTASMVIINSRNDNATAAQDMARVMGELLDGSTVQASRVTTTGTTTARYEVVTFRNGSGVNLQKGTFAFDSTTVANQNVAITAVDPARTWVYGSWDADTNGLSQDTVGLDLASSTTVGFHRDAAVGAVNNVHYSVVEFPNDGKTLVQRGVFVADAAISAGDDAEGFGDITIPTPVSALNKAFTDTYNVVEFITSPVAARKRKARPNMKAPWVLTQMRIMTGNR
jgi:hypothetical protein